MEAVKHLPVIAAGNRPPRYSVTYGGIDAFNDQMMARMLDLSLGGDARQRDETHRAVDWLPSRPPTGTRWQPTSGSGDDSASIPTATTPSTPQISMPGERAEQ